MRPPSYNHYINLFTDIIDLDSLGKKIYTQDVIVDMSSKLAALLSRFNHMTEPINHTQAQEILSGDIYSGVALPRQVGQATLGGEHHGL